MTRFTETFTQVRPMMLSHQMKEFQASHGWQRVRTTVFSCPQNIRMQWMMPSHVKRSPRNLHLSSLSSAFRPSMISQPSRNDLLCEGLPNHVKAGQAMPPQKDSTFCRLPEVHLS